MLFGKKPAEERSPQELEIALQEAEMPQKGLKPFLRKNGKKLVAVLVVLVLLIALFAPKGKKKAVSAETQYTTVSPENRDITNVYSASGTLSAANAYTVKPLVKGEVLTADFEVGDVVEKGAVLYTIDSSDVVSGVEKAELNLGQAQRSYDDAVDAQYIRTDIGGTVASFKVRVGDVVTAGQEVAAIRDDTTLLLSLEFPAADAANFTVGQSAEVLLDSTFEAIGGTVQSVSGADTLSSGNLLVRTVTIAVKNTGNLTAAQAATATINGVSALSSARFSYQREQTVTAQQNGIVSALCVKEGAQVSADTALIQLSGDNLTKQVQNASDSLRSAELSVEDTQKQVDDYTITAPISGTIISKDVKVGDTVGTSASSVETMCVIYDMSYLEMTLNVAGDPFHQGGAGGDHHRRCHPEPDLPGRGDQRFQVRHHHRRHHHLPRHHPHRRDGRPAARHERHGRDRDGERRGYPVGAQRSHRAGQLCPCDEGFPLRSQRR